jgi:hypothetical protein
LWEISREPKQPNAVVRSLLKVVLWSQTSRAVKSLHVKEVRLLFSVLQLSFQLWKDDRKNSWLRAENSLKFDFETLILSPSSADRNNLKFLVETEERTQYWEGKGFVENFVQTWRSVKTETWKTWFFNNNCTSLMGDKPLIFEMR